MSAFWQFYNSEKLAPESDILSATYQLYSINPYQMAQASRFLASERPEFGRWPIFRGKTRNPFLIATRLLLDLAEQDSPVQFDPAQVHFVDPEPALLHLALRLRVTAECKLFIWILCGDTEIYRVNESQLVAEAARERLLMHCKSGAYAPLFSFEWCIT